MKLLDSSLTPHFAQFSTLKPHCGQQSGLFTSTFTGKQSNAGPLSLSKFLQFSQSGFQEVMGNWRHTNSVILFSSSVLAAKPWMSGSFLNTPISKLSWHGVDRCHSPLFAVGKHWVCFPAMSIKWALPGISVNEMNWLQAKSLPKLLISKLLDLYLLGVFAPQGGAKKALSGSHSPSKPTMILTVFGP